MQLLSYDTRQTDPDTRGFRSYSAASYCELVPLLQIAPSKVGAERLLPGQPRARRRPQRHRLTDPRPRQRHPVGAQLRHPRENLEPALPLLFQRAVSGEHRPISDGALREILQRALAGTGIHGRDGQPLIFTPHAFRRIFVTDAPGLCRTRRRRGCAARPGRPPTRGAASPVCRC